MAGVARQSSSPSIVYKRVFVGGARRGGVDGGGGRELRVRVEGCREGGGETGGGVAGGVAGVVNGA